MDHLLEKATRQHTKDHNSRLVLRTIYEYGEISRAALARLTQLTRTTVSDVVGDLIARGLVEEVGHGATGVGRTPMLLSVVDDSRLVVAVSVTNDEIHGALVNLRGGLRQQARMTLTDHGGAAVLAMIYAMIDALARAAEQPLLGIGITTPGLIDPATGTVLRAINVGWEDLPLGALLQERYGLPASIANDSQTLALARYMFGEPVDTPNLVLIKVGQGIGAGIVLGGHLFAGDGYGAGEIGHMVVVDDGPPCKCGNRGCLETVASSAVILRQARALAADPASPLHGIAALTIDDVARAARDGDAGVRAIVEAAGRYLAIAVANIVSVLNVRQIVISGRVAPLGDLLGAAVRDELGRRTLPALAKGTLVEVVAMGPDAPLVGAAAPLLTYDLGLARLQRRADIDDA
ncbi:ROK family transcriptional regulator [Oscillochloris sp. ZM17-4]|uniref:ROK family transcriptional regulator n=1 Tax=Oscillochloris sp. ZM17-4 TaxID=2866714 RepID=UPI001C72A3DF|nr:ROK family transcriptional regulator [Oscillochloris sp. ZM17-4]MBX0328026.1 ROK family transcriptional regulator [Oscillochloris sp. ZM17-4]